MAPFSLVMLFALSSFASETPVARENLSDIYKRHAAINPKSCESVYYGLFADDKSLKTQFNADGHNFTNEQWDDLKLPVPLLEKRKDQLHRDFNAMKKHVSYISNTNLFLSSKKHSTMAQELGRRVGGVTLDLSSDVAIGGSITPIEIEPHHDHEEPLAEWAGHKTYRAKDNELSTQMQFSQRQLVAIESRAANAFILGHELAHSLHNWVPQPIEACLARRNSIGAHHEIPCNQPSKSEPVIEYEQLQRMIEEIDKNHRYSDANYGAGTFSYRKNRTTVDNATSEEELAKALKDLQKTVADGCHPEQFTEAYADYVGIAAATEFILKNYSTADQRRNAALAVIFAMPPSGYRSNVSTLLNKIGSKQTNERRVLRILLSHQKFRRLIGCEFERGYEPPDCLGPQNAVMVYGQDQKNSHEDKSTIAR